MMKIVIKEQKYTSIVNLILKIHFVQQIFFLQIQMRKINKRTHIHCLDYNNSNLLQQYSDEM
jgi:hypothetical protein